MLIFPHYARKFKLNLLIQTARDLLRVCQASPELFDDEQEMLSIITTLERVIETYGYLIPSHSMKEESVEEDDMVSRQTTEEEFNKDANVQSIEQID